ncbi:hypothetical protein V497_02876 [Pseudogymnoascus sp. VKM F-4516 (FW-969)]|nr:hypothetical protein V497_02876 [Pseudogymnoascus sp. VKM F-4516 (FW-969)]
MSKARSATDVVVKLIVGAGQASPSPPVGPALGSKGVKSMDFCKEFNARTAHMTTGVPIPARVTVRPDRSFHFELRTPTTSYLLLTAANAPLRKQKLKGAMNPGKESVGTVTLKHVYEIAKIKQGELRLITHSQRLPATFLLDHNRISHCDVVSTVGDTGIGGQLATSGATTVWRLDANSTLSSGLLERLDNIPPLEHTLDFSSRGPFAMAPGAQRSVPGSPAVRFASSSQEIEPVQLDETSTGEGDAPGGQGQQLRDLTDTLSGTHLQSRRMSHFNFEPVSLPASRVPSTESFQESSRHPSQSSASGRPSLHSRSGTMQTPPLTPAVSGSREAAGKGANLQRVEAEVDPTTSAPQITPPTTLTSTYNSSRPGSSGQTSLTQPSIADTSVSHRKNAFAIGPSRQSSDKSEAPSEYSRSVPPSREQSPSRGSYSRPFTPAGEPDDPYASNKRPPQSKNLDTIEPRFVFSGLNSRHRTSPSSSTTTLPRSCRSSVDLRSEKKSFSSKKDPSIARLNDDALPARGSMSELKRFLKIGSHHKSKRSGSPSSSIKSGTKTPTSQKSLQQLPFGEDHGLTSKYGKFGKVLGAGAGGSVRLMKRSSDGTTFAVKEFRARHAYETEKEYTKKVTAEFCIGSTLHHGNIIETLDIIREKGKWYEVMEYAPYDLFAIVMTGKMSREEVACSFLQILSGVTFIHSMGLAHRDLKLDNVVVNEFGIMKIIDFGSASMFKYPFETEIVLATGIVGSDPYLAPEVYDERKYDPQPADIWSLAIIFCCMSLRRFPWKMPRLTDNSYRLFASPPSESTEGRPDLQSKAKSETEIARIVAASQTNDGKPAMADVPTKPVGGDTPAAAPADAKKPPVTGPPPEKKAEVIKGPWRLLRLLPRETRHIIGRMLEIDPRKRATMAEVLEDPWISGTVICRQDATSGHVISAAGHTHTLEPPSAVPAPAGK